MPNRFDQFDAELAPPPSRPPPPPAFATAGAMGNGPIDRSRPERSQRIGEMRGPQAQGNRFDRFDDEGAAPQSELAVEAMEDPGVPADMLQPQQPQQPGIGSSMLQHELDYRNAARQSTSWEVRNPQGEYSRPLLGEAFPLDDGALWFKDPQGNPVRTDKAKHVVLNDEATGKMMVFARTPETDQSGFWGKVLSVGQMLVPGMATGPVTGVSRTAANVPSRAAQRLGEVTEDAAAHARLGVRPFGPAFGSGPVAATAKQVAEVPIIGGPVVHALKESVGGARQATANVGARYGQATTARDAGVVAQEGIERFKDARPADILDAQAAEMPLGGAVRSATGEVVEPGRQAGTLSGVIGRPTSEETSLKSKQAALYERAWRHLPTHIREGVELPMQKGRAVKDLPRVTGDMPESRAVLDGIADRNLRMMNRSRVAREEAAAAPGEFLQTRQGGIPNVALPVRGGVLGEAVEAIHDGNWKGALQTMRDMRSEFRRLSSGMSDTERNVLKLSDIGRLEGAITQDMVNLLQRNVEAYRKLGEHEVARNMERAIREFRRADTYTRLSMERIETIERLFRADTAEGLVRNITNAALAGSKGNEQLLATLRRTLQPEEMGEIASSIIAELGRPVGSARGMTQELNFSVGSFMTKWENMSPRAKELLFAGEHRQSLDDLVRVVNRLANVEALTNTSRSLSNAQGIGAIITAGSSYMAGGLETALGALAAVSTASVLFSRPSYVKWVTGYARLKAAQRVGDNSRKIAHINQLARMAKSDPKASIPVLRAITAREAEQKPPQN